MIGLGCMRLSTSRERDHRMAIQVIHAALDAGATLLDTADAYCLDESEAGHNERWIAEALNTWHGNPARIQVATKGGLRRPGGRWLPDGRASHLRAACEASRRALGVDCIDLYQLHAVDPRTPLETSVRALAALQSEGKINRIGLCNVNVAQIEAARQIVQIDAVQVSLSVLDAENLRNGVAEYCRDNAIPLIAYRPLGGPLALRLSRDPLLGKLAQRHDATAQEIALAWLCDLAPHVIPVPGATRLETARSLGRVLDIALDAADREQLDARFPAGLLLRIPRSARRPPPDKTGEVVLVIGMPGAGKSTIAHEFESRGYTRLNRDDRGGRLRDLASYLDAGLAAGRQRWVLDNTYATRSARNEIIECAWRHNTPVRCVWLKTATPDAQINAITRLIEAHGRLPSPDELRKLGKSDHRYFGPDAQFRFERQLEPPTLDEGFSEIEERPFIRQIAPGHTQSALLLEYDEVLCSSARGEVAIQPDDVWIPPDRIALLKQYHAQGWLFFAQAWRPQIARAEIDSVTVQACFQRTRELLGFDISLSVCPHDAGPPICWCRKPLPGLPLEFAIRNRIALKNSVLVGRSPADRTLAQRLGVPYQDAATFFSAGRG
jgi:aryl-alcohol dehydrogenase-like predicted oxidoreductase/histidinol phosphatase-like enzyme